MNPEQWSSIIRTVLALAIGPGSYLVAKGVLTADQANQLIPVIVPAVMAIGGVVLGKWGVHTHSAAAITAAVNSPSAPGVKVVKESSPSQPVDISLTGAIVPQATK